MIFKVKLLVADYQFFRGCQLPVIYFILLKDARSIRARIYC